MDLFQQATGQLTNLLPRDGVVHYYGPVMPLAEADHYFQVLRDTVDWQHDKAVIFGKEITTKRRVAWYGDKPYLYRYSGTEKLALPWTPELLALKELAQAQTGETYNSCLMNLYSDGSEGVGWHSDGEPTLKKHGAIASYSFGAARKFAFKHKVGKETVNQVLEHGSLLVMKGECQSHWVHRLTTTKTVLGARVNLTFRTIVGQDGG